MSFPSRKSQDQSRRRAWAKTAGAYRDDEPEEKRPQPDRQRRKPRAGELAELLPAIPPRARIRRD
jgi:hypothetical protein